MPSDKLPLTFFAALLEFCEECANYCSNTAGLIHLWSTQASKSAAQLAATTESPLPQHSTCVCASALRRLIHFCLLLYFRHQHPVDNAGIFSFVTLHWLSPLALKAYKVCSLSIDDVWGLSCHEASEVNYQRWSTCNTVCLMKVNQWLLLSFFSFSNT